ncbi:MAG: AbrB/MazE/SpoVT family DNA-binding domain-containing protein [Candidatus Methanodesulfokora washburnensis]
MALRLKVGRKGYVILPKAIREAVGIEERDEVLVEVGDGIILRPVRSRVDADKLRDAFKRHLENLKKIEGRREPKPGELAMSYLEEEFNKSIY